MSKWEMVRLGDVCDGKSSNIAQKDLENNNGAYPIYGASGLIKNVDFFKQEKEYIAIVKDGAGVGRAYVLPSNSSIIGTMQYIIPKDNVNTKYLYYLIVSLNLARYYSGATIPHIYFKDYKKEIIPLPPLEEQEKIAKNLDTASELVKLHKTKLEELDKLIQSVFYDMFGDPVTNEKGWSVEKLNDVCDVRDGTHDSPKYVEYGYPLITSKNIAKGSIDFNQVNYIDKEDLQKINKRSKVDNGDILMPMIGTVGNPIIVETNEMFAVKNVAIIKFTQKEANNIYIKTLLSSTYFEEAMRKNNKGGTQKFMSLGDIRNLKFPLPPLPLQEKFASIVTEIEKQKENVQNALKDAQMLYNSLMQEYFE